MNLYIQFFQVKMNHKLNTWLFKHAKASSMTIYIVHFFWIEIPNRYIVWEYKLSALQAFPIVYPLTLLGSWFTFFLVKQVPMLGLVFGVMPVKKKREKLGEGLPL